MTKPSLVVVLSLLILLAVTGLASPRALGQIAPPTSEADSPDPTPTVTVPGSTSGPASTEPLPTIVVTSAPTSTTPSSGVTSTTLGGSLLTTTTTDPLVTTTTEPVAPKPGTNPTDDLVGDGDAGPEEVPTIDITVPPRRPGDPILGGRLPGSRVVIAELGTAKADLVAAETIRDAATVRVEELTVELTASSREVLDLKVGEVKQVARYSDLQTSLATQTVNAYMGAVAGFDPATVIFDATDANDYGRRRQYARSVVDSVSSKAGQIVKARAGLGPNLLRIAQRQAELTLDLEAAKLVVEQSNIQVLTAGFAVQVFAAGSQIFISGFVFPVADPHTFIDSYGAPREVGNADFHYHEGTDVMAAGGTPLFAAERGVISKISNSKLGGTSLWVKGESNTAYYYAHLSAYASGMRVGKLVEAGSTVGYVGTTGNAAATAPHLHFEIHPNGGPAINPYPLLKAMDDVGHKRPVETVPPR